MSQKYIKNKLQQNSINKKQREWWTFKNCDNQRQRELRNTIHFDYNKN